MAEMTRVLHLLEQEAAALLLVSEVPNVCRDALAKDVVAKHDDYLVAVDEGFAEPERFGDSAGLSLIRKLQPMQAEVVAVAEKGQELPGMVAARDDHDFVDAGRDQRLNRIEDHRLVVDGQQVLVRDAREWM